MFDGLPVPPLPPDAMPIGRGGQLMLFLFLCVVLVFLAYSFFELCDAVMSEEFRRDLEGLRAQRRAALEREKREGKSWWHYWLDWL